MTKQLALDLGDTPERRRDPKRGSRCDGCDLKCDPSAPMLRDEVWLSIATWEGELLCEACVLQRLGRGWTLDDLITEIPWNRPWLDALNNQNRDQK